MRFPLISSALQNSLTAGVVSLQLQPWRVAVHTAVQRLSTNALISAVISSAVLIIANALPSVHCCSANILTAGIDSRQLQRDEA